MHVHTLVLHRPKPQRTHQSDWVHWKLTQRILRPTRGCNQLAGIVFALSSRVRYFYLVQFSYHLHQLLPKRRCDTMNQAYPKRVFARTLSVLTH